MNMYDNMYERQILPKVGEIYLYTVKQGDYPYELAKRYNSSVEMILGLNGLSEKTVLQVGQQLLIPVVQNYHQAVRSYTEPYPAMYY
mgnify:FL=1